MGRKYKALIGILVLIMLAAAAGIFLFFSRMYQNDVSALEGFLASYEKYDQAVADFSRPVLAPNLAGTAAAEASGRKADMALVELQSKASVRISSLIRNDAGLMDAAREIASLSGKELDALKAYQRAAEEKEANLESLAKEVGDLRNQRQSAYARFRELAGQ